MAVSEAIKGELVAPPAAGDDICPLCHSWCPAEQTICDSCDVTGAQVGFPLEPVNLITLTTKPSSLRDWLTRYKGRPGDDSDPYDPAAYERIRALLGRYLLEHGEALADSIGPVDAIVAVPSGRDRPLPHPLESILKSLELPTPVETLLVRGPGVLDFRQAAADGFLAVETDRPRRLLLTDDVLVTSARLCSAARALLDAGNTVAGVLAVGRRINRDWGECQAMWDRQVARPFDWAAGPLLARPHAELMARLRTLPAR